MEKEEVINKSIKTKSSLSKTIISLALENKFLVNSLRVMRTELTKAYTTRNNEEKLRIINHTINHINNILSMNEYSKESQYKKLWQTSVTQIVRERK